MADPDDTIRIPRPGEASSPSLAAERKWRRLGPVFGLVMVAGLLTGTGGAVWLAWRPAIGTASVPIPAPPVAGPAAVSLAPSAPAAPPRSQSQPPAPAALTEAQILAQSPAQAQAYRFALQPEVVVIVFASYAAQGDMLNRIAALVEKAGFPRDRILPADELDQRIRAEGGTPETFYYGHDYAAASVLHFFDMLDRSGLPPTPGETVLRRMTADWGWQPGTNGALITLVKDIGSTMVDPTGRATILRHELSHGLYFTSPAYAGFVHDFWQHTLTEGERSRFRLFLANDGYDTRIDDLVVNETQAYLMHTPDPKFFNAKAVGIDPARLDLLRGLFLTGMPPGWLRDCTTVPPTLSH